VSSSEWVTVLVAGMGILGTLGGTVLAQRGEARRAVRAATDAREKERRKVVREDYQKILRFVADTRIFVLELRRRFVEIEDWSAHADSDAREVEDLEARAQMLRRRCIDELPDVQALVGVSAPDDVVTVFDEIARIWPEVVAGITTALYFKVDGKRLPAGIAKAVGHIDHLLALLKQARELLRDELLPAPPDSHG
jgi:hypothetical protein